MAYPNDDYFSNMLNENVTMELLWTELTKRDWLMSNIEIDNSWLSDKFVVPFAASVPSSVRFKKLTPTSQIAKAKTGRGLVSEYKEAYGSMVFNHRELAYHGKITEQNFLKLLPQQIDKHMEFFKFVVSQNMLTGKAFTVGLSDGDASGNILVADPERLQLNQAVEITSDVVTTPILGFVKTINPNTGNIRLVTTVDGTTGVNLTTIDLVDDPKIFVRGQNTDGFQSIVDALLPAAAGGSATLYGITKTDFPFTQAIVSDGGSGGLNITDSNILQKIFEFYARFRKRGKGNPFNVLVDYNNFAHIVASLESSKKAFNVVPNSRKTSAYGYSEIEIAGFAGVLKLIAVQEMTQSEILFLDLTSMKFATNKGFMRLESPQGQQYTIERTEDAILYILDHVLYGELIVHTPEKNAMIYGVNTTRLG